MVQSEIQAETTTTKITIRRWIIIVCISIGVFSSFSQLFFESRPIEIDKARTIHIEARESRDQKRIEGNILLEKIVNNQITDIDEIKKISINHLAELEKLEKKSETLYEDLKKIRSSYKVFGFRNMSSFLDAIGNPIFIFSLGLILLLVSIFLKKKGYHAFSSSLFFAFLTSLISFSVYFYWCFSSSWEIHKGFYIVGLIFASLFTVFFLSNFLKSYFNLAYISDGTLDNVVKFLFDFIFIEIKDNHISKDEMKKYINSSQKVANKTFDMIKKSKKEEGS